ncbi:MAG: phosphatidate cytidylyltransferase [Phycisphaeraceae bacterium]
MLKYRLIFGPIMIAALVAVIYFDNRLDRLSIQGTVWQSIFAGRAYLPAGLIMLGLFLAMIPFGTVELCAIFRAKGIAAHAFMVGASGMAGCLAMYILPSGLDPQLAVAILTTLVVVLFLATLVQHSWRGRTQGAIAVAGVTLLSLIYMGFLPGFFILIRRWHSAWVILAIILITKSCDIGAYFTGRAIGKHKLIPWLSPGKTWEGLIGGIVLSMIVAVGVVALGNQLGENGSYSKGTAERVFHEEHYPLWAAACAGMLIGAVGQFGDLIASLFKRDAGIKDSGTSIPGFGGLLDVADSPLIVAPLAYWLLSLMHLLATPAT